MSIKFYQQLRTALETDAIVLATVVKTRGSAPREIGAKMAVCADGAIIGTIGGGAGEAKVIAQALKVYQTGEKQLVTIDLTGASGQETEGICGGKMQVWLERWAGEEAIALVEEILALLKSGQSITLITPLVQERSPYLQKQNFQSEPSQSFQELLQPPPTLLIVGAGHVAVPLAQVASIAGFHVVLQDDRAELVNQQRFPEYQLFSESIATALNTLDRCSQLYVALVTRSYLCDLEALQTLLERPLLCQYIGTIGSQKRIHQVLQTLGKRGISRQRLQRIHAPIGLDLGVLSPAEIAVSIVAELIKVRRGGTGLSLSERMAAAKPASQADESVHLGDPDLEY